MVADNRGQHTDLEWHRDRQAILGPEKTLSADITGTDTPEPKVRGGLTCGPPICQEVRVSGPRPPLLQWTNLVSVATSLQLVTNAFADLSTSCFTFSQCAWKKFLGQDASYPWAKSFQRVGEPAQSRLQWQLAVETPGFQRQEILRWPQLWWTLHTSPIRGHKVSWSVLADS